MEVSNVSVEVLQDTQPPFYIIYTVLCFKTRSKSALPQHGKYPTTTLWDHLPQKPHSLAFPGGPPFAFMAVVRRADVSDMRRSSSVAREKLSILRLKTDLCFLTCLPGEWSLNVMVTFQVLFVCSMCYPWNTIGMTGFIKRKIWYLSSISFSSFFLLLRAEWMPVIHYYFLRDEVRVRLLSAGYLSVRVLCMEHNVLLQ